VHTSCYRLEPKFSTATLTTPSVAGIRLSATKAKPKRRPHDRIAPGNSTPSKQWLALNAAPGSRPNYGIDHPTSNVYDNQHIPENEQAMSNTISGSSKSRIHRPPQRDGGEPDEPAPLRYMRSVRSGPSDDSLSRVVGKKTRAQHSSWWSGETRQVLLGCRTMIIT
jgi:hypothetical protein